MSGELAAAVAGVLGAPQELVMRSAQARAAAQGVSVEEILASWSGGAPLPATVPPTDTAPAEEPEATAPPAAVVEEPAPTVPPTAVETPAAEPDLPAPAPPRMPRPAAAAPPAEAALVAPAAGLTERLRSTIPAWLVGLFAVLPLFGLLYLITNSSGVACGEGGQLAVARDGRLLNCDGSDFEGRGGVGGEAANFLALGQEVYTAVAQCASCHGANGQGGTGPAFTGGAVVATFPTCDDHVRWVQLGSTEWSAQVAATYGASAKPVQGGMPGFAADLSDEQLRAVVAFERIRFGGADPQETLTACGLVTEEAPTEGDQPGDTATGSGEGGG